jgi:hypothetical protein
MFCLDSVPLRQCEPLKASNIDSALAMTPLCQFLIRISQRMQSRMQKRFREWSLGPGMFYEKKRNFFRKIAPFRRFRSERFIINIFWLLMFTWEAFSQGVVESRSCHAVVQGPSACLGRWGKRGWKGWGKPGWTSAAVVSLPSSSPARARPRLQNVHS